MRYLIGIFGPIVLFCISSCATKECKCQCKCSPCEKQEVGNSKSPETEKTEKKKGGVHFKNPFSDEINIKDILK